jgi:phosphotriesterase-related protein
MDVQHYVIAHADQIPEVGRPCCAGGTRGAWVAYDAIGTRPGEQHARMVVEMLYRGWGGRLLLSQDAGWYQAGEPRGGTVRPYTALHDEFLPALRAMGADEPTIRRLLVENPARALAAAR